jgi:hypothetical protein
MLLSLCLGTALLALLAVATTRAAVIPALVLLLPSVGMLLTPSMAILGRVAERRALPAAAAFTAGNLAWALGEGVGALGSPWLQQCAGAAVPYLVLAGLCAGTAIVLTRRVRGL